MDIFIKPGVREISLGVYPTNISIYSQKVLTILISIEVVTHWLVVLRSVKCKRNCLKYMDIISEGRRSHCAFFFSRIIYAISPRRQRSRSFTFAGLTEAKEMETKWLPCRLNCKTWEARTSNSWNWEQIKR